MEIFEDEHQVKIFEAELLFSYVRLWTYVIYAS